MTVEILHNVSVETDSGYELCFQWCNFPYDNKPHQKGYRFIWKKDGKLLAVRGQSRIESAEIMFELIQKATKEGWFISCEKE